MAEKYSVEAYLKATGVSQFAKAFSGAAKNVQGLERTTERASLSVGTLIKTMAGIAATVGIVRTLRSAVDRAFTRIDTMEQFDRVMTTMTGSAEVAEETLSKINDTVKGTAFGLDVAASSVQNFVTSGIEVEAATRYFESWGDAVAFYTKGTNEDLATVTDALSKMATRGKVDMEQLGRIMEAGIPAMDIYAEAMGISTEEVAEQMRKGKLDAGQFMEVMDEALANGTEKFPALAGAAKEAGASWRGTFDNMRAAVARGVTNIIQSIDDMLTSNGLPDMRTMVANFGSAFEQALTKAGSMIGPFVNNLVNIYNTIKPWLPLIASVVTAFITFNTTVGIINGVKNAVMGLRTGIALMNAAIAANPIALVIAILAGLAVLLWQLYNRSETFRTAITNAFNALKEFVMPIVQTVVDFVMQLWGELVSWWNQHNQMILQAAKNIWNFISKVISKVMKTVQSIMKKIWPFVEALIISTWEAIKGAIQGAIKVITGIIQFFAALFTGNWRELWAAVKQILSGAVQFVVNFIQVSLVGRALKIGKSLLTGFVGIIRSLWSRVTGLFRSGINKAVSVVTGAANRFLQAGKNIVTSIAKGIRNAISSVTDAIGGVVNKVRNFLPFSPAKEGPLKDIHRLDFAGPISTSVRRATPKIQAMLQNMLALPQIDIAGQVARTNSSINTNVTHSINQSNSRIEMLLEKIANSNQVVVLDSGELVGATYNKYDRMGGNRTVLAERWGR